MALSKHARELHEAAKEYASLVQGLRAEKGLSHRAEKLAVHKAGAEIRLHRAALEFAKKRSIAKPQPERAA